MVSAMRRMNETMEDSQHVVEKMNELTDNMILARNIAVGGLVAYAAY